MHIKIKAASSQDETAFIYAIIRELLLQFFLVQCIQEMVIYRYL